VHELKGVYVEGRPGVVDEGPRSALCHGITLG
jgi:hypothetical protein